MCLIIKLPSAARELGIKNGEKEIARIMRRRVRRVADSRGLSVCMSVCELSPPSCLDLAGSSFQGMLGSYVVVHCFDLSWICSETNFFC